MTMVSPYDPKHSPLLPPDRLPPSVLLSWPATAYANFGGYRLLRRPRATPVLPWQRIAAITIPTGYSAAAVQAQHTSFVDAEAGFGVVGGRWRSGFDYDVRAVDLTSGLESAVQTTTVLGEVVPASPNNSWIVCNAAPWLSCPLWVHESSADLPGASTSNILNFDVMGRDGGFTRTRRGTPPRTITLSLEQIGFLAADQFDVHRAASISARQLCLLEWRGDRYYGTLEFPNITRPQIRKIQATMAFHVTAPIPAVADYNRHARVVLNGSSQYATTPTAPAMNPSTAPWAMVVAGIFSNRQNDVLLSRGTVAANGAGAVGFYCNAAGQLRARVHGVGGSLDLTSTASWYDTDDGHNPVPHVAVLTFDGTNYTLYRDGVLDVGPVSGTAVGSITSTAPFVAGADNGGASGFTAAAIQAWGLWIGSTLSSDDALALSRYLLGYWGYRMPGGATAFYNAADARSWNGVDTTLKDLAGLQQNASLVAAPTTRGIPFMLADLDRQW